MPDQPPPQPSKPTPDQPEIRPSIPPHSKKPETAKDASKPS